jgi:putative SOS response-associated peptidase YedK
MCARFSLASPGRIVDRYPQFRLRRSAERRFNIAPTQDVLAVRNDAAGEIATMRWGLVPAWAQDAAIGPKLINARAETLAERPAFSDALQHRRCVIFADGFYEWSGSKKHRRPHRFVVDGGDPFVFAGLYEHWGSAADAIETCTIVTCVANPLCATVHDRMPVILGDEAIEPWLNGAVDDAVATLVPFATSRMTSFPVTTELNRVTFDDPRSLEPIAEEATLF